MSKTTTSVYVDDALLENVEEDEDWDKLSHLVEHLLEQYYAGENIEAAGGVAEYCTEEDHLNLADVVMDVVNRMDAFENEGQPVIRDHEKRLRRLEGKVERLENLAPSGP